MGPIKDFTLGDDLLFDDDLRSVPYTGGDGDLEAEMPEDEELGNGEWDPNPYNPYNPTQQDLDKARAETLPTRTLTLDDACIMTVGVDSTGPMGVDNWREGYTSIWFKDEGCTGLVCLKLDDKVFYLDQWRTVCLTFNGDAERRVLAAGLRFMAEAIEQDGDTQCWESYAHVSNYFKKKEPTPG